ncbi:solute carrier family 15 member 4-like [Acropora millepora]|uniref:solute carrier family 15 member 4-like n=1 Tax=Acropora millepora TaxID=45264 RepID=UPI001CF259B4|nr:solute carrier family 15 member 4-like [Acropora millepora]XP_044174510.1 solute carrier family 15 member 4-like [Acropora millepora]XP_044174511.1 solute carrier family 15 member 4-like [Acropora millepora]
MLKKEDPELAPILVKSSSRGAKRYHVSMPHHPGPIRRRIRILLVICILFTELCERLTFYGVVANLVLYCRDYLKLEAPLPSSISLAFQGTSFFSPVIGGWIADTLLGRYNTIYGGSLLYLVGTILLAAVTFNYGDVHKLGTGSKEEFLGISLLLISVGTGGIKANVSPLGADQIENEGVTVVQRFFDWFYWFIQLGSFLAYTAVVSVQQDVSFFYGYVITASSIFIAIILFVSGRNYYVIQPHKGSYMADTCKIIWQGLKNNQCICRRFNELHWLDRAKESFGGIWSDQRVEDVKAVVGIAPIFLTFILYWTIYGQGQTSYLLQGSFMKLKLSDHFTMPAASLYLFEITMLLILIPVVDRIIYPMLRHFGVDFTPLKKMGVGMLFAMGSVIVAGLMEIQRKRFIATHGYFQQHPFNTPVNASQMNIFYQVPQYVLMGTGEVLTSIPGLAFAYSQSPVYLRGVIMGLNLATIGIGFYVAGALAAIVRKATHGTWYPQDLNNGKLENYFFFLAAIMLLNFVAFVFLAQRYKYVKTPASSRGPVSQVDQQSNLVNS